MEKFARHQTTHLKELCGEEDRFRGDIEIVPLKLSSKPREFAKLAKRGNFHYKEEILDIFTKTSSQIIHYPQLFAEAELDAKNRAVNCLTEKAKAKQIQRHSNHVFVSGEPGLGKSVLSNVLVQEMLDPSVKLYETDFIFYIRFRDLNYDDKMDFLEFLTMHDSFCSSMATEDKNKILEHLQKCSRVSIVMDGLDEANIKSKIIVPKCNILEKATALTFMESLFFGDLFPLAKKIITSRPRQLAELSNNILPQSYFVVNLLGLSDEGQRKICSSICRNDPSKRDKILEFLNNHPDLKSYCYVPINAIVAMRILQESTEDKWKKLDSLTSIVVTALNTWFLHKLEHFQAKEIAEMAYEAFRNDRFYFKKGHLTAMGVDFQNLMTFMTNVKFSIFDGTEIYCYFVHLMWQELFVAFKLILFTNEEMLNTIIPHLNVVKYEMVLKFLFGLCNEDTQTELLGQVEAKDLNSSADRIKCKELLKNLAIHKLRKLSDKEFKSVIQVFGWIHEMRDEGFTVQAANCLNNVFYIKKWQILPTDVPCLNYVLRNRRTPMTLRLERPEFVGNSCKYFCKELCITLETNSNVKVSNVSLLLVLFLSCYLEWLVRILY